MLSPSQNPNPNITNHHLITPLTSSRCHLVSIIVSHQPSRATGVVPAADENKICEPDVVSVGEIRIEVCVRCCCYSWLGHTHSSPFLLLYASTHVTSLVLSALPLQLLHFAVPFVTPPSSSPSKNEVQLCGGYFCSGVCACFSMFGVCCLPENKKTTMAANHGGCRNLCFFCHH